MNVKNEQEERLFKEQVIKHEVGHITQEVRQVLKKMKNGKSVGPDDVPIEVWKHLGELQ